MFKMYHPTFFLVPVAWLAVLTLAALNAATPMLADFGITPRMSWAVLFVQIVVTGILVTPLWRGLWWICPPLNRWVFPDLNGEWDVEGETNWTRIDATLKAANRETPKIDMRSAPEDQLPPLGRTFMRARITQSWVNIQMSLWNPAADTPIKGSETLAVQPFRGENGRHGLIYVFEQENKSPVVSDDRKFLGAVRIIMDRDNPDLLCGQMWSDRIWPRGMNTAAEVRFTKRKKIWWWQRSAED